MIFSVPGFRSASVRHPSGLLTAGLVALTAAFSLAVVAPAAAQSRLSRNGVSEDTFTGNYLAGRTATVERDTESAALFYGRALRADPTNVDLLARTFLLRISNGDVDQAIPLATRLLAQDKANDLARMTLAVRSIRDRAYGAAKPNLAATDRGASERLAAGLVLAWATYGAGDVDGALAGLGALSGPAYYDYFKNFHRALIADAAGRKADALKFIKDAYDIDHSSLRMADVYSRILARNGNPAAAQKVLLDFIGEGRSNPIAGAILKELGLGRTPPAVIRDAQEGAAEALYSLALVISRDGSGEQLSTIYLQLAIFLNPRSDMTRLALGEIFQNSQNSEKAVAVLKAVPEESLAKPIATVSVALNLDALKRTDEAIALLRKQLTKIPGEIDTAMALGDILRSHKRFDESVATYGEALSAVKTPLKDNWRIYYSRGIALERLKRWPEAESDFKKALELVPNQAQVLNYLGYSWVDMGLNLDNALGMIKAAVDLRPEDGYIVDSLGWAYFRLGKFDQAVTELERAVGLKPEDPTINDHLGDAYWQVGRRLEATFQWAHARDLSPEPEDLAKIVKKLESGLPQNASINKG